MIELMEANKSFYSNGMKKIRCKERKQSRGEMAENLGNPNLHPLQPQGPPPVFNLAIGLTFHEALATYQANPIINHSLQAGMLGMFQVLGNQQLPPRIEEMMAHPGDPNTIGEMCRALADWIVMMALEHGQIPPNPPPNRPVAPDVMEIEMPEEIPPAESLEE